MGKGNKLPSVNEKKVGLPDLDDFFQSALAPVKDLTNWNNKLDGMTQEFRKVGADIRRESDDKAPPPIGKLKIEITDDNMIRPVIVDKADDATEIPKAKLDKVTKEYLTMVEKKSKMMNKRLTNVRKLEGCEEAKWKLSEEDDNEVVLEAKTEEHDGKDQVIDLKRSLGKFNDRVSMLATQLTGPPTLGETVSAIINTFVKEMKEKGKTIAIAVKDGMPSFDGIPDSIEDFVPKLIARGWQLLQDLIAYVKKLLSEIPELLPKIEESITKGQEMVGKVKEMAGALNPPPGMKDMLNMAKAAKTNLGHLKNGPTIIKTLTATSKDTSLQIANAVQGQQGTAE